MERPAQETVASSNESQLDPCSQYLTRIFALISVSPLNPSIRDPYAQLYDYWEIIRI